jgi:hypothetical protein
LYVGAPFILTAQDKKDIDKKQNYIPTDINYQNNTVLMGRFDSITIPCIVPSIGCYDA